jgi:hypothetical protein
VPPAFAQTAAADTAATTEDVRRDMKKRIFILISAMTFAMGAATKIGAIDLNRPGGEHDNPHAPSSGVAGEQEQKHEKYTCPMHPEVVTEHPGD